MGNESFEVATKWLPLDPVDHESTIAGSKSNTIIGVNIIKIVPDILPALDKVFVGSSACKNNALLAGS